MDDNTKFRRNVEYIKISIKNLSSLIQQNPHFLVENSLLNDLIRTTLDVFLDFNVMKNSEILPEVEKNEILECYTVVAKVSQDHNTVERVKDMMYTCIQGWTGDYSMGFLTGKVGKQNGSLDRYLVRLQREDSITLETKIKKVKELFDETSNKKSLQMAVHFFETYKRLCILTRSFQDSISYICLVNILDNLLIALVSCNMYEHLNSMISVLPTTEKLRIIRTHRDVHMKNAQGKHTLSRSFVILEIIKSLLLEEFQKPPDQMCLLKCNTYVQFLLDFAMNDQLINRNLELVLMSPVNMKVDSTYFFLVANSIRDKLPNKHEILILKLYITGLTIDISKLEKMKFNKQLTEQDFQQIHKRIFMVLVTLSFLIQDPIVKRQCVRVAKVFEAKNVDICKRLQNMLDSAYLAGEGLSYNQKKPLLDDLRSLLSNFDNEVKNDLKMSEELPKIAPQSYETFKYFNNKRKVQKRLSPIRYPGIEAGYERDDSDSDEEDDKGKNKDKNRPSRSSGAFQQIRVQNKLFFQGISERLKRLKDPLLFPVEQKKISSFTSQNIRDNYLNVVSMCSDFIVKDNQLYFKLNLKDCSNYEKFMADLLDDLIKKSQPNLFHDYTYEKNNYSRKVDLQAAYHSGRIEVWPLTTNNYNFYDITNILFLSIVQKKSAYDSEVVLTFNKNSDDDNLPLKKTIKYMLFRGQPEFCRYQKSLTICKNFNSMVELNLETYDYITNNNARYRYTRKRQKNSGEDDGQDNGEDIDGDVKMENGIKVELEENSSNAPGNLNNFPAIPANFPGNSTNGNAIGMFPETSGCSADFAGNFNSIEPVQAVIPKVPGRKSAGGAGRAQKTPTATQYLTTSDSGQETPKPKRIRNDSVDLSKYLKRQTQVQAQGVDQLSSVINSIKVIEEHVSLATKRQLVFDLSNLENQKILYFVKPAVKSLVNLTILQKNKDFEQRTTVQKTTIPIELPETVDGSIDVLVDESTTVGIDDRNELYVKIQKTLKRVSGTLYLLNTLSNFRFDVDIFEHTVNRGKLKVISKLNGKMVSRRPKPSGTTESQGRMMDSSDSDRTMEPGEVKIERVELIRENCLPVNGEVSVIQPNFVPSSGNLPAVSTIASFGAANPGNTSMVPGNSLIPGNSSMVPGNPVVASLIPGNSCGNPGTSTVAQISSMNPGNVIHATSSAPGMHQEVKAESGINIKSVQVVFKPTIDANSANYVNAQNNFSYVPSTSAAPQISGASAQLNQSSPQISQKSSMFTQICQTSQKSPQFTPNSSQISSFSPTTQNYQQISPKRQQAPQFSQSNQQITHQNPQYSQSNQSSELYSALASTSQLPSNFQQSVLKSPVNSVPNIIQSTTLLPPQESPMSSCNLQVTSKTQNYQRSTTEVQSYPKNTTEQLNYQKHKPGVQNYQSNTAETLTYPDPRKSVEFQNYPGHISISSSDVHKYPPQAVEPQNYPNIKLDPQKMSPEVSKFNSQHSMTAQYLQMPYVEPPARETSVIKISPNKQVRMDPICNNKTVEPMELGENPGISKTPATDACNLNSGFSPNKNEGPDAAKIGKIVIQENIVIKTVQPNVTPKPVNCEDPLGTDFEDLLLPNVSVLAVPENYHLKEKERLRVQAEQKKKDEELKQKMEADKREKEQKRKEMEEARLLEMKNLEKKRKEREEQEREMQRRLREAREAEAEKKRLAKEKQKQEEREKKEREEREEKERIKEREFQRLRESKRAREQRQNAMKNDSDSSEGYSKMLLNPFSIIRNKQNRIAKRTLHSELRAKMRKCSVRMVDYFRNLDRSNVRYNQIYEIADLNRMMAIRKTARPSTATNLVNHHLQSNNGHDSHF